MLNTIRRSLRTQHAQFLRQILLETQCLDAILDVLEHSSELFHRLQDMVEGRVAETSADALQLCTACTRTVVVLFSNPAVMQHTLSDKIYTRLIAAMFSCGAPLKQVWLTVPEFKGSVLWFRSPV